MIRDTWRAVLVVVTAALLREIALLPRPAVPAATPAVATNWQPQPPAVATNWQPQPPAVATNWQPQQTVAWMPVAEPPADGKIRRAARSVVDLAEAFLEVVR